MALTRIKNKGLGNAVSFENINDTGNQGTKVAVGTTAQRGTTQGQFRFNTTTGLAEYYAGSAFKIIDTPPQVASVDDSEVDSGGGGNQTIVITGTNFQTGAVVTFVGTSANFNASSTTVNSDTQITAVAPKASFLNAQEPYSVKVTASSGLSGTLGDAINVDNDPTWSTSAGSLGASKELGDTGTHFTVSASDPDGDTINYTVQSGSLPTGTSLNSSTGAISGTIGGSAATFSFTLRATAGSKTADRAFTFTTVVPTNYFGDGSDGAFDTTP